MSDIAIKVRGLGKKYHIGEKLPQRSLAGSIKNAAGFPWKVAKSLIAGKAIDQREEFWALKDVAFDVKQGEVLGIIGRNGAGKSTLLKILSRITTPTEGEVELFGRVGCLLEVGTGFHPELTGRENVFLNGSLLGMSNVEIKQRFDEIVDFSGVERFLDTPVKFYSSGMYTRLAFSVAAHLNPEILIVDEVLAVGDAEFQKKCLGKMDSIAKSGRTIIFVSHNMQAVKNICQKGIWLNKGLLASYGEIAEIANEYINSETHLVGEVIFTKEKPGDNKAVLHAVRVKDESGNITTEVQINKPFAIEMEFELFANGMKVAPNLHIKDAWGNYVCVTADTLLDKDCTMKNHAGKYKTICRFPANLLNSGTYYIGAALTSFEPLAVHFHVHDIVFVSIHDPIDNVPTRYPGYVGEIPGAFRPLLNWELLKE